MGLLRTATFDEPDNLSDCLKFELAQDYCRDAITIKSGEGVLLVNTLLGKITAGAASVAAKAGGNAANTGLLTLDVTTPVLANAKVGVYTVRCIAAASNSGTFRVEDPDGIVLGDVAVAATFADGVKFSIADSSQDFVVGEGFDITVAEGSGKYVKCKPTALDGSAVAAGLLAHTVDATSADKSAVAIVRGPAVLSRLGIKYDDSFDSAAKKNKAIAQLAAKGIIVRDTA